MGLKLSKTKICEGCGRSLPSAGIEYIRIENYLVAKELGRFSFIVKQNDTINYGIGCFRHYHPDAFRKLTRSLPELNGARDNCANNIDAETIHEEQLKKVYNLPGVISSPIVRRKSYDGAGSFSARYYFGNDDKTADSNLELDSFISKKYARVLSLKQDPGAKINSLHLSH